MDLGNKDDSDLGRQEDRMMAGMTVQEISRLVNRYIGVSGGYLGDFSYSSHRSFYPEYCDLDFNPDSIQGTTRERFIDIATNASPADQAKIVRGILEKYPPGSDERRTKELHDEFLHLADRLQGAPSVKTPTLASTSEVVTRALRDAETLLKNNGATSGVDRVHTALHGHLRVVCLQAGIEFRPDATMVALMKQLRDQHPALSNLGPREQDIAQVLRALSSIMDSLNPIRNNASVAHPNDQLLDHNEAMLVINVTRSVLHYLDGKLSVKPPKPKPASMWDNF